MAWEQERYKKRARTYSVDPYVKEQSVVTLQEHYIICDISCQEAAVSPPYFLKRYFFAIVTGMLTIIFWVIVCAVGLFVLYYIGVVIFTILGIKQMLGWAKEEMKQVPEDYQRMRKEVKNENAGSEPVEKFIKGAITRWFHRLR